MYYKICFPSEQLLFHNLQEAKHLLLKTYLWVQEQAGTLLDYSLIPTSLDFLLQLPISLPNFTFLPYPAQITLITSKEALLVEFRNLNNNIPCEAKNYPLCGTYEAYHVSECYSVLGKTGEDTLIFPLQTLLETKHRDKKLLT